MSIEDALGIGPPGPPKVRQPPTSGASPLAMLSWAVPLIAGAALTLIGPCGVVKYGPVGMLSLPVGALLCAPIAIVLATLSLVRNEPRRVMAHLVLWLNVAVLVIAGVAVLTLAYV